MVSAGLQAFLKSATALFAQLQIALRHPLQIILFFSSTSNKWLTRREPSSGKSPPPLEPAEKVLNVKVRKSRGKKAFSVGTFPSSQPPYSRSISTNYSVCGILLPHTYSNLRHFTPVSMNHVQGFPGGSGFSCMEDMTVLWVSAICLRRRAITCSAGI